MCVCMYVCALMCLAFTHALLHMRRSENGMKILFNFHMDSEVGTQVLRFGSKDLNWLSHLSAPRYLF